MDKKFIKKCENRGENAPPHRKSFNFKCYKKNTLKSLYDVEFFLNYFNRFIKYIKLYNIFKR